MDRSERVMTSPTVTPARNELPPVRPNETGHSVRQSVERASFEKALDRIRARDGGISGSASDVASDKSYSDTDAQRSVEGDQDACADASTSNEEILVGRDEQFGAVQTQSPALDVTKFSSDAIDDTNTTSDVTSNQINTFQLVGVANKIEQDLTMLSAVPQSESPLAAVALASDSHSTQAAAGSSTRSTHVDAERVSDMMRSLENMPGTPSGQWTFGVLGNSTGIVALQLQRAMTGGWQVNVSIDEAATFDEKTDTQELKLALLNEGHDIDSVVFSYDVPDNG